MERTQEIKDLSGRDRDKIATVLYCHQYMALDHDQPTMAAGMVYSQLAGYSLNTLLHVAECEGLNMTGHELGNYFNQ
ncbi:MAG: hypothetical protein ACWA44_02760 [Thiotrichales bacterium]